MKRRCFLAFMVVALMGCTDVNDSSSTSSSTSDSTDLETASAVDYFDVYFKDDSCEVGGTYIYLKWSFTDNDETDDYTEIDDLDWSVLLSYTIDGETTETDLGDAWSTTISDLSTETDYSFTVQLYVDDTAMGDSDTIELTTTDGIYEETILTVSSFDDLDDALDDLEPNTTITVSDGDYTGDSSLAISGVYGTEDQPVIIQAETVGGVSIDLESTFSIKNSSYITLDGFSFTVCDDNDTVGEDDPESEISMLKIVNSDNITITNNVFDEEMYNNSDEDYSRKTVVLSSYGGPCEDVEFGYNTFKDKDSQCGFITTTYDEDYGIASDVYIHHNYFHNLVPVIDDNGDYEGDSDREAICFGDSDSADEVTNNIIEYNLFDDCDGENEVITNKTSSNIYRYNTFKNCFGVLSMRFGDNHEIYGNYFYGDDSVTNDWETTTANYETGGIRLYGTDHKVYNNFMYNLSGESTYRMPLVIDSGSGDHYTVEDSIIAFNTILECYNGIGVGPNYSSSPVDNYIANNIVDSCSNTNIYVVNGDSSNTWEGNLSYNGTETVDDSSHTATELVYLDSDPLLEEGSYKLGSSSPAIDAAQGTYDDVTDDMDEEDRGTSLDIGADEYSSDTTVAMLTADDVGPGTAE
jgi:hypothetical protein